jgi:hypothetical protein
MMDEAVTRSRAIVADELAPTVDAFRALQDSTGRVTNDRRTALSLLDHIRLLVGKVNTILDAPANYIAAFDADVSRWLAEGLESPPAFDHTVSTYSPPKNNSAGLFIAPFRPFNGPPPSGTFLECFLAYRQEPLEIDELAQVFPHYEHQCQAVRLFAGSFGVRKGNCIACFPEAIATTTRVARQQFALFFFNKFYRIFHSQTLPAVQSALGNNRWYSTRLTPPECYRARCVWGFLHDYYHHQGPRPLDQNLGAKAQFFAALLDEVKVDCQATIFAYGDDVPYGREIVECILFDRIFRLPAQHDALSNVDAGAGMLLFEWLLQYDAGVREANGRLFIDIDECVEGLPSLVLAIENVERESADYQYHHRAEAFSRQLLPEGIDNKRLTIPDSYERLVKPHLRQLDLLDFTSLTY